MKRGTDIIQRVAMGVKLPGDLIIGMPLIEIFGNCRVLVENHYGVTGYSDCEISVCTDIGTLFIRGSRLEIANMNKHRLVITGTIEAVIVTGRR